jgi:hypothetical protein
MAWTFILTDIATSAELVDLTPLITTAKINPRLNRPLQLDLELPADIPELYEAAADGDPNLHVGTRAIKAYRNDTLRGNVIVWLLSYDGDADTTRLDITGYDPLVQLIRRPVRTVPAVPPPDEFDPVFFVDPELGTGGAGAIVKGVIDNSILYEGALLIATDGTCDASADLEGNIDNWPVMISDFITTITDTRTFDIVLLPIEGTGGVLAQLNVVDAWGADLSGTVHFDYGTGDHTVSACRRVIDMEDICNKLWYYLGPKIDQQHWRGNITGHDAASTAKYGVYMDVQIYDSADENTERALYTKLRASELNARKNPKDLLHVTPAAGAGPEPFDDYGIGDTVAVNVGAVFGPAVSASQRIFEFTVNIDTDGVERVDELVTAFEDVTG